MADRVDCESPLTGVSNPTTASGSRDSRANRLWSTRYGRSTREVWWPLGSGS